MFGLQRGCRSGRAPGLPTHGESSHGPRDGAGKFRAKEVQHAGGVLQRYEAYFHQFQKLQYQQAIKSE